MHSGLTYQNPDAIQRRVDQLMGQVAQLKTMLAAIEPQPPSFIPGSGMHVPFGRFSLDLARAQITNSHVRFILLRRLCV